MKRRIFLATTAAFLAGSSLLAAMMETKAYTSGLVEEELSKGNTVFVDYFAPWCSTCHAQSRVIDSLRAANPAYDENITFIKVDWDTYKKDPITTSRNIPRHSTLILLRGEEELGRIVAGTSEADIKALLDKALLDKAL